MPRRKVTEETDFGSVEYHATGAGDHVIALLHGAATGPDALSGLAAALAGPSRSVIVIALHGYGSSYVHKAGDIVAAHRKIAAWVLARFDASSMTLFGHSMGGLVALATALETPIARLVLYEPIVLEALDRTDVRDREALRWDRAIVDAMVSASA
ncbi:MAG: alpha/beta hydrolase, partial [Gammaproteobacteria bacterium]|nr:alpha/beta hydrolase [Gammaproteobacteria bacterium]